jgi:prepilin-type N-terminal cleavage/methylation domain-containing protein
VKHRTAGFSLLEVLVAMTILGMAFAGLFSMSSRSLEGMRRARDVGERIEFARTKMAQMELISDLRGGDRASGVREDGTRWLIEVLPFIGVINEGPLRTGDSVVRVRLTLEWQGRNEPQAWSIETYRLIRGQIVSSTGAQALHSSLEDQLRVLE